MVSLKLKPGRRARVLDGHPWVFAGEVVELLPPGCDGDAVALRDSRGRFIGSGLYNSRSQIVWRRFSFDQEELDESFLRRAIEAAIARRQPETARRLVWSESDRLPGLVVDQFDDILTMQALTLGIDRRIDIVAKLLGDLLNPSEIVFRNDAPARKKEGLELGVSARSGKPLDPVWRAVDGIQYRLDLLHGQKTGFYLDQRRQHRAVAAFAAGRRALDAFCNQGGFALNCAAAGAADVLGIDSSSEAIQRCKENAAQNKLSARFEEGNVFDFLRHYEGPSWDLIVLDPPPFAKSRGDAAAAARAYKEINLRACKLLSPGGILATYTCSHPIGHQELLAIVGSAAIDARRNARVIEFAHQPPDHPVLPGMPESEYLRGLILAVE